MRRGVMLAGLMVALAAVLSGGARAQAPIPADVTGLRSIERWLSVRIGGKVREGRGTRRH